MEIGMAAAVLPGLKILSLKTHHYESTTPESSFFYHLQSVKAQAIQKPGTLSVERGRLKGKYLFQHRRPEFSSDLIFSSIQVPHMLILELKCIVICLAGSHLLSLSCYNGKKLEQISSSR